jgi:hypothetical protein
MTVINGSQPKIVFVDKFVMNTVVVSMAVYKTDQQNNAKDIDPW